MLCCRAPLLLVVNAQCQPDSSTYSSINYNKTFLLRMRTVQNVLIIGIILTYIVFLIDLGSFTNFVIMYLCIKHTDNKISSYT